MTNDIKPSRDIARLIEIMAALRTPGSGCPWDLEQTFETIAPYTIEEAYEVADAIERNDTADLKDELGDLLLQVVYHARMAEEQGAFSFGDVVESITQKMIRRHPHVFGVETAKNAGAVKGLWDKIKAEEKAEKDAARARPNSGGKIVAVAPLPLMGSGRGWGEEAGERPDASRMPSPPAPNPSPVDAKHRLAMVGGGQSHSIASAKHVSPSILADIPIALPALTRAIKLQDKAAKVGFDWPGLIPVFDKVKEELAEFEEVAFLPAPSDSPPGSRPEGAVVEEFGDLLFVLANVARHLKIDPEAALRGANQKFVRRFGHIETRLSERGSSPAQSSLEEMDQLWDEAKFLEKMDQE